MSNPTRANEIKEMLKNTSSYSQRVDKLDESIVDLIDTVYHALESKEHSVKSLSELVKTLKGLIAEVKRTQLKREEYEKNKKVDFHDPTIQKGFMMMIELIISTLTPIISNDEMAEFKQVLVTRLIGWEELLNAHVNSLAENVRMEVSANPLMIEKKENI